MEFDHSYIACSFALGLGVYCKVDARTPHTHDVVTYEVGGNERLHPDPTVVARMREVAIGTCQYGCKIYADPKSAVRVLAHNSAYGCPK